MRVAIVGLGPKGLFALERLLHRLADGDPSTECHVDAYEPHPAPGAGPAYDPAQPSYLRMNFRADQVDMWCPGFGVVPERDRRSFVRWRSDPAGDPYPSRAEVGRYLTAGLALIRRHAPAHVRVRVVPTRVTGLDRADGSWTVRAEGAARTYDEVLIATGHEQDWSGALLDAVGPADVAPGAKVAARGFALTFIDTALELTEGRGGAFEAVPGSHRLRYVAGTDDVGLLIPYSRSGRPMLAKPALQPPAADAPSGLPERCDLRGDLLPLLAAHAERPGGARGVALAALEAASRGVPHPTPLDPAGEIGHSLDVAHGERPPDLGCALGHAWRALYPAIVERFGGDGLADASWPAFRRLAACMERVAFGPPPVNAAKLLALVEAGRVDLRRLRCGPPPLVDAVLDTVIPPPGAVDATGLLPDLAAQRYVRVRPQRRGLEVDADAACVGADGWVTPGLSAIGRPTEDWVIGNDTLSRRLHPHADRWASRVADGLTARSAA